MFFDKMARNTKKKLAIFAGTSKCLIYAEAKYCASEMSGERKYYECSRTEYCCPVGCCVSPGLHFHHLWYYWILVIIMFLVCSGGGWWYRYWLQGRYRAAASAIPRSSNPRAQNALRGPTCQGQRARITYNSARNTVLLHRMWKGPPRNGAAPPNNGTATTSSHYQNMNVVLNDANCPYYQLYGPPPSYETVIAQSRGKISNPVSPTSSTARLNMSSTNMSNTSVPPCFTYPYNPSRLNNALDQAYQENASRQLENENIPFTHFPRYCVTNGIRPNMSVPYEYQDSFHRTYRSNASDMAYFTDKSSDNSDPENQSFQLPERYAMLSRDGLPGSRENPWEPNNRSILRVHGKVERQNAEELPGFSIAEENLNNSKSTTSNPENQGFHLTERYTMLGMDGLPRTGENLWEPNDRSVLMVHGKVERQKQEEIPGFSTMEENTNNSKSTTSDDFPSDSMRRGERRVYGGSLKAAGRYAGKVTCVEYSVQRGFSRTAPRSCDGIINSDRLASANTSRDASPLESTANADASSFQSNPSNNVILESFVSDDASASTMNVVNEVHRSRLMNGSTNSDLESKHRLDRSKSLD